jgi:NAD(P)-dependent dehydrogenase (short-subunit alcohol dehydrogenase family)
MNTQVVLITGGLTGIGRATALAFAREGAGLLFLVGATKKGGWFSAD